MAVLPTPPPGQAEFGVDTPFPVNDHDEVPGIGIHIDDSIIKNGRIDTLAFKPLARLGYSEYTTTENVWKMSRPDDSRNA